MPVNGTPLLKLVNHKENNEPSTTNATDKVPFLEIIDDNFDTKTTWGLNYYNGNHLNQGKWVIHFPKGGAEIDAAWKKVKQGVRDGVFIEAKASCVNDKFEDQVIVIYTYNHEDEKDVKWVHSEIVQRGITTGATDSNLEYITNAETKKAQLENDRKPNPKYTSLGLKPDSNTPLLRHKAGFFDDWNRLDTLTISGFAVGLALGVTTLALIGCAPLGLMIGLCAAAIAALSVGLISLGCQAYSDSQHQNAALI